MHVARASQRSWTDSLFPLWFLCGKRNRGYCSEAVVNLGCLCFYTPDAERPTQFDAIRERTRLVVVIRSCWIFAQNRNFTSVFGDRTSFRAKGKGCRGSCEFAVLPQFLAIKPHFVRKGCRGHFKIQFYCSFWRSISCERVAFRAVSLALPRAFKREIEKKEKARGQESKRARENVKM